MTSNSVKAGPQPEKKRLLHIEILRILAAFLVIVNHTNSSIFLRSTPEDPMWTVSVTYFFICKIAVPLFLFISGALLLGRQDSLQTSGRRVLRILTVLLVFSLVYYLYLHRGDPQGFSIMAFLRTVLSTHVTNAFWYLYLYVGILLLLPLLQKMAAAFSVKQLQYLLLLSVGVMGLLPLLKLFLPLQISAYLTLPAFSPYIGMLFAGYYLEHHVTVDRKMFALAAVTLVCLVAFQVVATRGFYYQNPASYLLLDNRTYLTITGSAACVYLMAKYLFAATDLPGMLCRGLTYVGGLTFGVYLFSDLMILLLAPLHAALSARMGAIPAVVLWEIAIFIAGAAITAVLKLIPGVKKAL